MGLGPRIDLRVSQQLVMTPQLQQAIKLLALSNLELEAVIAEELAKNPLLEAQPGEGQGGEKVVVREDREYGEEAADPTGSDELIGRQLGTEDSPVDMDWREAALETDSLADVGSGSAGDEAFGTDVVGEVWDRYWARTRPEIDHAGIRRHAAATALAQLGAGPAVHARDRMHHAGGGI